MSGGCTPASPSSSSATNRKPTSHQYQKVVHFHSQYRVFLYTIAPMEKIYVTWWGRFPITDNGNEVVHSKISTGRQLQQQCTTYFMHMSVFAEDGWISEEVFAVAFLRNVVLNDVSRTFLESTLRKHRQTNWELFSKRQMLFLPFVGSKNYFKVEEHPSLGHHSSFIIRLPKSVFCHLRRVYYCLDHSSPQLPVFCLHLPLPPYFVLSPRHS